MTSSDENFLGSLVAFFDHGLLMIEDSKSSAIHEGWDAATDYVHFDRDSLYVAVQSVVDGPVSVTAYRASAPSSEVEGLVSVFSDCFESQFGRLRIHDPEDQVSLTITGISGFNHLAVLVDELGWAARVVVIMY